MAAGVHDRIAARWGAEALEVLPSHGLLALVVEPGRIADVARSLKGDFGFDMLLDITAVDWPARTPRFDVVYHFYSTTDFVRVRLKARVPADAPAVDTLVPLYDSARFAERECHEMYGIDFRGNGDLRPILLYEGFVGHPLRKDYPKHREQPLVPYLK
jgi:NADH-quinone oxidoreductase subunit C